MQILHWLLVTWLTVIQVAAVPSSSTPHRQTIEEAARWARHVISDRADGIATLASTFPANYTTRELAGRPHALLEYYAPGPSNGSLYLLLMPISQSVHNVFLTKHNEVTLTIKDEEAERKSKKGRDMTDKARMTLWGTVQLLHAEDARIAEAAYVKYHPDAKAYVPPYGPHTALWAIFNPTHCYFLGGFGDRHYIGYLPIELYQSSGSRAEIQHDDRVLFQAQHKLLRDW